MNAVMEEPITVYEKKDQTFLARETVVSGRSCQLHDQEGEHHE